MVTPGSPSWHTTVVWSTIYGLPGLVRKMKFKGLTLKLLDKWLVWRRWSLVVVVLFLVACFSLIYHDHLKLWEEMQKLQKEAKGSRFVALNGGVSIMARPKGEVESFGSMREKFTILKANCSN